MSRATKTIERNIVPMGRLSVEIVRNAKGETIALADWGGWTWRAVGEDEQTALERLDARLGNIDPFRGEDEGWGHGGMRPQGRPELDPGIYAATRERMLEREAELLVERVIDQVLEWQARCPAAFVQRDALPVPGVELKGFQDGKELGVFASVFGQLLSHETAEEIGEERVVVELNDPEKTRDGVQKRMVEEAVELARRARDVGDARGWTRSAEVTLDHQIAPADFVILDVPRYLS